MELVFFGSGAFGVPTLASLAQRHSIRGIVTQPDRPAGRGGELTPTPVAAWAEEHLAGVPVLKPERVSDPAVIATIEELLPRAGEEKPSSTSAVPSPTHPLTLSPSEAFVVIAFGQKLPRALLEGRFAINLHASLLPRWRGAAPINAAILAGDRETGNSVITLADRMDAGLILGQSRRAIEPQATAGELHDLLAADGPALVERVLAEHAAGRLSPVVQEESLVTLAPKLSKAEGWVDFAEPAAVCRNRIHGLTPWPGVSARLGELSLKLCRAQEAGKDPQSHESGTLVDVSGGVVACGGGTLLRILEVHPASKRRMTWAEFVPGHRIAAGSRLIGRTEAR